MNPCRLVCAAVCGALLCTTALAADRPAAKPGGKILTRDELRACLAHADRLKQHNAEAAKTQAALDSEKNEIGRATAALEGRRAALDPNDAAAVGALQAYAEALDKRVDAYNLHLPEFNAAVQALLTEKQSYKDSCADRPYDEKDYYAIKRGK